MSQDCNVSTYLRVHTCDIFWGGDCHTLISLSLIVQLNDRQAQKCRFVFKGARLRKTGFAQRVEDIEMGTCNQGFCFERFPYSFTNLEFRE